MMQGRRHRHLLHGQARETASRLKPEGVARFILGRPLGSENIFPYWFYRDPFILKFVKAL